MIDIENAKKFFLEYVKPYNIENYKILRKIEHTLRTADVAKKIAEKMNLSKEDIELAELIGLLHDIGRFEQIRIYDTFNDMISIDHAQKSVEVLFEEGNIRKYISEEIYDEIIKKAIYNHNKSKIEDGLDEKTLLHSKIIRDADKTDIYEVFCMEEIVGGFYNYNEIGNLKISDIVIEQFRECKQIDRKILNNDLEWFLSNLSYVFDYNFKPGLEIVEEKQYIRKMLDKIKNATEENSNIMKEIEGIINNYIHMRLAENMHITI